MNAHQWKRAFCLISAVLIILLAVPALGETFPYTAVATDAVRLRGGPSSSAAILTVIRQGDEVLVTGSDGNYKIVEYEGRKGYVVSAFLAEKQAGAAEAVSVDPAAAAKYPQLVSGSSGAQVKALQQALAELDFHKGAIDSKYGSATAASVKAFQEGNSLPANGVADANTQELLFEGKPKNSRGTATDVKTLPPIAGYTIRPGDRGDAVAAVQNTLIALELYKGAVDGDYGTATQNAVKAFQKANKLKADGIVGEKTFAALQAAGQPAQQTLQPAAPEATMSPSFVFTEPQAGEATYPYMTTAAASVNLRKRASLSSMRILTVPQGASIQVLEDTGNYLKASYKDYTGYVAKEFINIPEQYLDGKSLAADQGARVNYQALAPGAEGRAVRALQHALTELGFYSSAVDGKFGANTTAGLKALQKRNGLRETGVAQPELQQLIFEKRVRNSKNRLVYAKTLPPLDNVTMREGDFGDAVYELHQMLVKTGHYDRSVGYEYTRATTNAVKAYQKDHSIKVTGNVDSFTLLSVRTAAGVSTSASEVNEAAGQPLTEDNVVIIRNGTTGLAVSRLQERLAALGYYSITPDGVFNGDDIIAVQHFQRVNRLPVTGVADLATQQVLYAGAALGADAQARQPIPSADGLLKIGSVGEQVSALQSRLITLQFLSGKIDGIFGTQTAAAVTGFQRANNLRQDGIAGSQTLGALYGADAKGNQPAAAQTQVTAQTSLKVGSTGSEVTSVQQRLIALKYLSGNADGIYGPATFLAVKDFQAKNKLDADGIAGKLTIARLNSGTAVANSVITNVPIPTPAPTAPVPQVFTAPRASEVRNANWYSEIRPIASRLRTVIIYDFISGAHYNFRFFSLGKHADGTTLTAGDTAIMNKAFGASSWTPRPVWVIFSDGRVYMGSTHTYPHEVDYVSGNDLNGHLCVHFPREMEEAALTGPYAVSHQNAILAGWDLTQNMAN